MDNSHYKKKKHKEWRDKVLRRDNYLCQKCIRYGKKVEATHAHHIRTVEEYPELKYKVENGQSLCLACHNREHPEKGGRKN